MADENKPQTITVVPGPTSKPNIVILWERDAAHPDGEIYLVGGDDQAPTEVAETAAVLEKLASGELARGGGERSTAKAPPAEPTSPITTTSETGASGGGQKSTK